MTNLADRVTLCQAWSTTRSFSKVERLFIFKSMSSCIDATCCSCDHAVKRTLDCLVVDVAAFGNNSHSVKSHEAVSNCWVAHLAARSKFCDQFVNTVEQNPGFLDQLIVSDEAIFSLNSEINNKCQEIRSAWRWHPATNPEPQQPCFSKF